MNDIDSMATFLGWCSLINCGLLIYFTLILTLFKDPVKKIHSRLLGVCQEGLEIQYFTFLGNYKLAIIVLNLVPYCALKIMA